MSWSAVSSSIDFWSPTTSWTIAAAYPVSNVSAADQALILSYLENMYLNSATARALLDGAVAGGVRIRIGHVAGSFGFSVTGAALDKYIGIDVSVLSDLLYFNDAGILVNEKPDITIIHELIHNLAGLGDTLGTGPNGSPTEGDMNMPSFDYDGDVLRMQNTISQEMGYTANIQASYDASFPQSDALASQFEKGVSYTVGEQIDNVRIGSGASNTIDHSGRVDNSKDLLFGLAGDDVIKSGGGRDFVYGGDGNDTIYGGDGNDRIYGGNRSYTPGTEGLGYSDQLFGEGGDDALFGGAGDDVLDGGDGNDQLLAGEGSDILRGGAGNDTLFGEGGNDLLIGGGGVDTLYGGDGDDILVVGEGVNSLYGGAGDDWFFLPRGTERAFDVLATAEYSFDSGDSGDRIFWNGYELTGGTFTIVEEHIYSDPVVGTVTETFGSYLGDHGIIYSYAPGYPTLIIVLPTNEKIVVTNFVNGLYGLTFADPPDFSDYDNVVRSNIANNGLAYDFENLDGRAAALAAPGTHATPTAPRAPIAPTFLAEDADTVDSTAYGGGGDLGLYLGGHGLHLGILDWAA